MAKRKPKPPKPRKTPRSKPKAARPPRTKKQPSKQKTAARAAAAANGGNGRLATSAPTSTPPISMALSAAGDTAMAANGRIKNCEPSVVPPSELPPPGAPPTGPAVWPEDLRDETWWPINNQGSTGACVGFGVGDGLIRWHLVKKGRIAPQQALSVRYFWMAAKEMDEYGKWPTTFLEGEGTSIWAALKTAMLYGCLLEKELPLEGRLFPGSKDQFLSLASQRKVNKVHPLELDVDTWANWLRINGPLAVRLSVDGAFERANSANPHLTDYNPYPDPWRHGHAITLVGYQTTEQRFIIRNSWGTAWGQKGYAYASRDYARQAFLEAWGIYF